MSQRLPIILLLSALVCAAQPNPPSLEQVLSWLPSDTETVIGANGPFDFPDIESIPEAPSVDSQLSAAELDRRLRLMALNLFSFKNGGLNTFLKNHGVTLALEGSRKFRNPAALGLMRFEGCAIIVFAGSVSLDPDAFTRAADPSSRFEDMQGVRTLIFREKLEEDTWTTYVAIPSSNVAIVATSADYLREVLTRMRGGARSPRALPATLPEWKYVNTRAAAWGLRHYRKDSAEVDPSSPLGGEKAANVPDEKAVGLAFSFESSLRRTGSIAYLSSGASGSEILRSCLGAAEPHSQAAVAQYVTLRQPAAGVTEATLTFSNLALLYGVIFGLSAMLGHAIYL